MPAQLKTYADNMEYYWSDAGGVWTTIATNMDNIANAILAQNWANAHTLLHTTANNMRYFKTVFSGTHGVDGSGLYNAWQALLWIDTNWPAAAPVTMSAILSAMLGAKFTELQDFIGIEDAYRVALWNAPFNADFYAALARGFQKWP